MGEGFQNESEIMPFISSCNIACGYHAGDEETMRRTIELALRHEVAIGAHPSFADREHFGRREMDLDTVTIEKIVAEQVSKLMKMAHALGAKLNHVKPHGALYNMAARSADISRAVVRAIYRCDPHLKFMGMASSEMARASKGLTFIAEGFMDRRYASQTELVSRKNGGLLTNMEQIEKHLKQLLANGQVDTLNGKKSLTPDTLCVHGDTPGAAELIPQIAAKITSMGYQIKAHTDEMV